MRLGEGRSVQGSPAESERRLLPPLSPLLSLRQPGRVTHGLITEPVPLMSHSWLQLPATAGHC